jgi:rhodanese-related sulfurtransferase
MVHKKNPQFPLHSITHTELQEKINNIPDLIIINVLSEETYADCHIKGSINVPYDRLIENVAGWDKDKDIVLYCANSTCPKSKQAFELLADFGFTNLSEYSGGMKEWFKKGCETSGSCVMTYLHD